MDLQETPSRSTKPPTPARRPRWGVVVVLSLVIAGDTLWWMLFRPHQATGVPFIARKVLMDRPSSHAIQRRIRFYGWLDEQSGTWRFEFNENLGSDSAVFRADWICSMSRVGLWAPCATRASSTLTIFPPFPSNYDEFDAIFDERASLALLEWMEDCETDQWGRSMAPYRDAIRDESNIMPPMEKVLRFWSLDGRSPWISHPLAIAHDAIMALLTAVWVGVGLVALRRAPAWRREMARLRRGRCGSCGYELVGLPSPVCPECGRDNGRGEAIGRSGRYTGPDAPS